MSELLKEIDKILDENYCEPHHGCQPSFCGCAMLQKCRIELKYLEKWKKIAQRTDKLELVVDYFENNFPEEMDAAYEHMERIYADSSTLD